MVWPQGAEEGTVNVSGLCEAKQEYTVPCWPLPAQQQEKWQQKQAGPRERPRLQKLPWQVGADFQLIICRVPDNSWFTLDCLMFYQETALKSKLYIACLA